MLYKYFKNIQLTFQQNIRVIQTTQATNYSIKMHNEKGTSFLSYELMNYFLFLFLLHKDPQEWSDSNEWTDSFFPHAGCSIWKSPQAACVSYYKRFIIFLITWAGIEPCPRHMLSWLGCFSQESTWASIQEPSAPFLYSEWSHRPAH